MRPTIDTVLLEALMSSKESETPPGYRDYPLDIVEGEIYEVWLEHSWDGPKACVAVSRIATDKGSPSWEISPDWDILVDGQVRRVFADRVFRQGTATRPPTFIFPKVRKVGYSQLAQEIVSVQPMTAPSGLIFYQKEELVET
jgi:hypothetical protein